MAERRPTQAEARTLGRYVLHGEIAAGGMAAVHLGRLVGPVGFSRTVAIKRMHPHLARDPELVAAFLDEARLAARISHPNVVQTLDVVATDGELFLVMDYVEGESLSRLCRAAFAEGDPPSPRVVSAIIVGALGGLHAAHEARSDRGERLGLVHRDVSPQNILVGADGVARVLDFGVAKATGRIQQTREGELKGKLPYMSPEQIRGERVDRRTDIFAVAVVLWETLTGRPLFHGEESAGTSYLVLTKVPPPPSRFVPGLPPALDELVLRALEKDREKRFPNAMEMALALEAAVPPASALETGAWVRRVAADVLARRSRMVADIESGDITPEPTLTAEPARAREDLPTEATAGGEPETGATTSDEAVRPRRRTRIVWAGALALGALGGLLALVRGRSQEPPPVERVVEHEPSPALPAPVAPPPPTVEPAAPPPEAAAKPLAARTERSLPRARSVRRAPLVPAPSPPPPAPAVIARPPSTSACDNPFVVDRDGTKRPRPECFR